MRAIPEVVTEWNVHNDFEMLVTIEVLRVMFKVYRGIEGSEIRSWNVPEGKVFAGMVNGDLIGHTWHVPESFLSLVERELGNA